MLLLTLAIAAQVAAGAPRLGDAVLDGNVSSVKALLAAGAKVDDADETGMTPLMVAAAQGQTAIAGMLIAVGAKVDAKDRDDITALMRASAANRVATVALLLAHGADPNARMRDGATALTAAAFGGYIDVVTRLLERKVDPSPADQQGRTPLMAAAMNGHAPVVSALVSHGADVQAIDVAGASALRYAAARGHADIVDALANAGGKWGDLELTLAAEGCHGDLLESLLKRGGSTNAARGRSLLLLAAAGGCLDGVRHLIAAGADVNQHDANGLTPLMLAAQSGSPDLVRLLLAKGANPRAMDNLERTPAMFAELSREETVIALLRSASAGQSGPAPMTVESPTIKDGQPIPRDYTADGRNVSPPLTWTNVPANARQLAVICEDPDAGNPPPFVHWVIYRIPVSARGLPDNIPFEPDAPMPAEIAGAVQGLSGFRRPFYRGPAPPPGKVHHYHFVVYALDAEMDLKPGLTRADLLAAIDGHVIAQGELVGTYERRQEP
jgi:Raf kinase inhibitor-like YbhB/YbcL family protein